MHDQLIERSLCALRESSEDEFSAHKIGYVFEDKDHFGKDGLILRVHKYSALFSMAGCANTSSSMINADMFHSGLRYKETMVKGRPVFNEFKQFTEQFGALYSKLSQSNSKHNFDIWKPFGLDRYDFTGHYFGATPLLPVANGKKEILCVIRQ